MRGLARPPIGYRDCVLIPYFKKQLVLLPCSLASILLKAWQWMGARARSSKRSKCSGPANVRIVPGASGSRRMGGLTRIEIAGLIRAFSGFDAAVDVLLVDTAVGVSDSVVSFNQASQEVMVVVCNEPAAISDACARITRWSQEHDRTRFHVLANMTRHASEGLGLFREISRPADTRFGLGSELMLDYMSAVPEDECLRRAVRSQRAVVDAYPRTRAVRAFDLLARKMGSWRMPERAGGHVQFFVERLIQHTSTPRELMP